jgi:spore maturation protein CgeB
MDSVDIIAPQPSNIFQYGNRISHRLAREYGVVFNLDIPKNKIKKDYDLFFAFCQFSTDLLHVESLQGWKDHCNTSICWLSEIWIADLHKYRNYLKILSKFDYVILNLFQSKNPITEIIGNKCFLQPPGVDSILFCPYPDEPKRVIDVYCIGRRSEKTHQALLKMFAENKILYIYDSIDGTHVKDNNQHRFLFANLAKRSRYFIVNPGKIDVPEETQNQSEIPNRYYEGAAAGNIMIGEPPKNEEFKKIFYWPDAVIHLPYNSEKIDEIIHELDKQPQRQKKIREKNVYETLTKHDWAYRWETILKMAMLEPMNGLLERKRQLQNIAKLIKLDRDQE